jgi:serine protease
MQSNWSNDGATCAISHPVWGAPGGPNDFALTASPAAAFVTQGDATSTDITSLTETGDPESIDLSATGVPSDATASFTPPTMSTDGSSTFSVSTAPTTPFGLYDITITATGTTTTHTTTFEIQVGGPPGTLLNGVPLLNVSGAEGTEQFWSFDVPAGAGALSFSITGGTGDADLYVRFGAHPTDDTYDCRPFDTGNEESCDVPPTAGTWYVRVKGFFDFDGVALSATYATPTPLVLKKAQKNIAGATGSKQYWMINVPAGRHHVKFTISSIKTGNPDLYVKFAALPSTADYTCRPATLGKRSESCDIKGPDPGAYYVMISGVAAYTHLTVKAIY